MINEKSFYILGEPIDTEIGECNFLKVIDYPDYFMELNIMSLSKNHLINKYNQLIEKDKDPSLIAFVKEMEKFNLFDLVASIPELQQAYIRIFAKVFNSEEILYKINEANFDFIRKLILDMNVAKEEVINPNPEIQRAIERSRRVKSSDGDKVDFCDIVTCLVGDKGFTYDEVNEFTIYQLYMTYHRIAQIKNYNTSTLFATVAEKVKIDSWSKHIDLFAEENHAITKEEFEKSAGSLFGK